MNVDGPRVSIGGKGLARIHPCALAAALCLGGLGGLVALCLGGLGGLVALCPSVWDRDIQPRIAKPRRICGGGEKGGRDESKRRRAESQWIVAARPLCHLQYPVAYLSRLQRILPAAR